jgi:hypothetical protein
LVTALRSLHDRSRRTLFRASLVAACAPLFATSPHSAIAQGTRVLPGNVVVGELQGVEYAHVRISDKMYRLAPGARIRDRHNRIVVPVSAPQSGRVVFNFDSLGQVLGLWILTNIEIPYYPLPEKE